MPPLACVELRPYKFVGEGSLPVSKPVVYHDGGLSLPLLPNGTVNNNNSVANGWSVERSSALYGVQGWGAPYFVINDNGNVAVRPHGSQSLVSEEIDLTKVVKKVVDSKHLGGLGMSPPLIIRLPDVLRHRIESLQGAFDSAIGLQAYGSHFQGVYPVKSNQDRYVVENIVEFGSRFGFGLEAGSKPELLLAMSCLCKGSPRAFLVCNGYKDEEYVSLALISRRLDFNTVIVLEQEEELDVVINASRRLSIRPVVGLRAKLRTKHGGHFGGTSGEKGKFGLTTPEIVSVVRKLQRAGMLDCLQLLHFHIGSQIPSVDLLRDGVGEAAHIYCELVKLGANMRIFDIGGGLGIDYDGSKSGCSDMSVGYSLEEYATAVVASVQAACDQKGVEHPVLCSESGRALVSHHSVLIFDVVSVQERSADAKQKLFDWGLFADDMEGLPEEILGDYHKLLASASVGDYGSSLAYAERMKASCVDLFKCGRLGLESLAMIDGFCDILSTVVAEGDGRSPVAINGSGASAVCHINLSIFKSIPDFWAIGQLFPIMPIQRLNEQPKVRAVLSDLTCDSDGKVETFIGMGGEQGGKSHCLMMHSVEGAPNGSNPYYLGLFLGGAYQEALGGLHNLFGNPNVVHVVQSSGPHCFAITRALPGQTSADVLRLMMHEPHMMFHFLKCRIEDNLLQERGYGDGYEESVSSILKNIASAFDSLPYLSPSASSSDDDDDEEDDEEQWMSCSASLMDCSLNQRYC